MVAESECPFGQPLQLPSKEPLWPIREDQKPEVVHSVKEFLEVLQMQTHVDRVVVLPNGIDLLQQRDAAPIQLCEAARGSSSIRQVLAQLGKMAPAPRFRARLWHYSQRGREKEIKVKKDSKDDPKDPRRSDGTPAAKRDTDATEKKSLAALARQLQELEGKAKVTSDAALYISELRWQRKVRHPLNKQERVKTATNCDVYDVAPFARHMPLWERSEGGIFVGERGAGSGLHVDQCLWSNVGRNWCGFKLFAIWPWHERHSILDEAGKGAIFCPPLTSEEEGFLSRAKTVALVGPGDVWVFSGGQPHTAMCVGDGINLCAYESFVPANEEAVSLLVQSNTKESHWRNCWMDDDDLDELYEDVVDSLQKALACSSLNSRLRGRLEGCRRAMRESKDSYCKELWEQEDRGQRRRRREEEYEESSSDLEIQQGSKKPRVDGKSSSPGSV
ncbi:unnamed protein product [Durusdinium trenchii]|uniref:Bifunctional lysine-specific demethylase and histidyl-hydroxylase n=1 Tax=Durusdinium trenchii TaxID=1381693 RepID=A0ABP0MSI6_9DINO